MSNITKRCADVLIEELAKRGVRYVFTIPGGAEMTINDALYLAEQEGLIKTILVRHEQGGCHMADGCARVSGIPNVAMATSGPGALNLVTAAATANQDSVPMICVTGNVPIRCEGTQMFQECDILSVVKPIVKECINIRKPEDTAYLVDKAFKIAMEGRRGVVWIDVPRDVQAMPVYTMENLVENLQKASKPVIIAGHGVLLSRSSNELRELAAKLNIPVAVTLHGISTMDTHDPRYLGMVGLHGTLDANHAVHESDLVIGIGCRMEERITMNLGSRFAPEAKIVRIDIAPSPSTICNDKRFSYIHMDAKNALLHLLDQNINTFDTWYTHHEYDIPFPAKMLQKMDDTFHDPARIVVTDVGQNQIWATQGCKFTYPGTHVTSGGSGTMGFALPAAIGVQLTKGNNQLVMVVAGDGGFDMTKSELGTMRDNNLPIKIVVINNGGLGMVRQYQSEHHEGRIHGADHGNMYGEWTIVEGTAKTYGIKYFGCRTLEDVEYAWKQATGKLRQNPVIIELFISKDEINRPQIKGSAQSLIDMFL